jgi:secreted PhoX family phosphatase
VPQAVGGLVYELFIDKKDPSRLDPSREPITPGDGTNDTVQDGIRARPALGAKSHEGLRFDKQGFLYGIAESRGETNPALSGGIFRFVPDEKGDLSSGVLSAYDSPNGKDGAGQWLPLDRDAVQVDADAAAAAAEVNRYERPEDVETGQSTGKDRLNGGNSLYVAITDNAGTTNEEGVLNIDLSNEEQPLGYRYVGAGAGNASEPDFNAPDNLALDRKGNLAITEDGGGNGDDIFMAAPPDGDDDEHLPAASVERFASIKDCDAEGTGVYFALAGTERFARRNPNPEVRQLVHGETLFVNRQHSGQGTTVDQGIAIAPVDDDDDD